MAGVVEECGNFVAGACPLFLMQQAEVGGSAKPSVQHRWRGQNFHASERMKLRVLRLVSEGDMLASLDSNKAAVGSHEAMALVMLLIMPVALEADPG